MNKHAPLKSMKIRYRQYPFVSQDLKQHMSSRNKLLKTARCTGLPENWQRYRASWDDVKMKLQMAERQYHQEEIHNNE